MSVGRDFEYMSRVGEVFAETQHIQLMDGWVWQSRSKPHPYPRLDIPEANAPTMLAIVGPTSGDKECWVDAGTGHKFLNNFPMTPITIEDPRGNQNLGADLSWLSRVVSQFWWHIGGQTNSSNVRSAIAVPLFVGCQDVRILEKVLLYAAVRLARSDVLPVFNPKEVR